MKSVAITAEGPLLEGVFGPLSAAQDRATRDLLATITTDLASVAARLGGQTDGLELAWYPSGQTAIESFVEATDGAGHSVAFLLELRPGWFYGEKSDEASWEIELSVEIDCTHAADHGMHTVFEQVDPASSPAEATRTLRQATTRLIDMATQQPLDHWTARSTS